MRLLARHLEKAGIPTPCMGRALDILKAVKTQRTDFQNPAISSQFMETQFHAVFFIAK